jgi:protease I
MEEPRKALNEAGAGIHIVSPNKEVRGWKFKEWGDKFPVDAELDSADPDDFDALLLPGGVMNPDKLRMNAKAVAFVKSFFEEDNPVAAICHGPWTIIEAGETDGRRIASWPSLKTDLRNAGPNGSTKRLWLTGILSPAASPMIYRHLTVK